MTTQNEIETAKKEVNENYKFFKENLSEWQHGHLSEFALIHHQELVGFFESEHDAIQIGVKDYGLGNFSIQPVQHAPADLGHQSNALF